MPFDDTYNSYESFKLAHKVKNKLDNDYGAYRYSVRSVATIQDYSQTYKTI